MNARVSRRLRRLSSMTGKDIKQLKREYRAVPFHQRKLPSTGKRPMSHAEAEKNWREGAIQ